MKIGVIAPSNTMKVVSQEMRDTGVAKLRSLGFDVVFGLNIDKSVFHTAGTIEERISDFNYLLSDDLTDIIMPVFGGYNSNQLLSYLNYKEISKADKIFIGYSDTTALLLGIGMFSANKIFHGPAFASFCDPDLSDYTISGFLHSLYGKEYTYTSPDFIAYDKWFLKKNYGPREWKKFDGWKIYKSGKISGLIIGGNLETISSLAGTPYFPDINGKILFLEDATGNSPGIFHRNMTQLSQMGVFNLINGLILGKPPDNTPLSDSSCISYILDDVLGSNIDYPILIDVNCSHVDPIMTIPLNSRAYLNCTGNPEIIVNYREDK